MSHEPRRRPDLGVLRRQRALLDFALASLLRRRGKTLVFGAVLTLIVFLLASLAFLRSSVRLQASAMLLDAPDLVIQHLVAGRQELLPAAAVDTVRAIPGVAEAGGRLWGYYYDAAAGANYTVAVPPLAPPAAGEAAIGAGIWRSRQGYSRDVLALRSYGGGPILFKVKAVLPESADFIGADLMVVSEPDFRALFALPGDVVNDIVVRLAPGADAAAVGRSIRRELPGARTVARADMLATAGSLLDLRGGVAAAAVLAMVLALIIVAADKPAALSVEERREMGILRALGWSRSEVLIAKTWESLAVSIVALSAGLLAAYAHVYVAGTALYAPVLRGWAVLAPRLDLVPTVDIPFLAAIVTATLALPASGALLACYRPASAEPDAAMRQ